jgi:Fic family protein
MSVRVNNTLVQWVKFFLVGVIETSKNSIQVFKDILNLKNRIEQEKLPQLGSKIDKGHQLIKQLYQVPIIDVKNAGVILQVSTSTANRLIKQFCDLGILTELTGYKRNRKYIFKEYFEIFQNRE